MLYLIKFGGNAISNSEDLSRLCEEIWDMKDAGSEIILVHGGGPEISAEMERLGLKPEKINGVRVTDAEGLEVASKVLRNINERVTNALYEADVPHIGMPAYVCTLCKKVDPIKYTENGFEKTADLGLVGDVVDVDTDMLKDLINAGVVPVIYPIGSDGIQNLNVNADMMAAGIAARIECDEMIAITDVPGVLRDVKDPSSKYDKLTVDEALALIKDGTISGGMIPKVEACINAIRAGARVVRMVNGKDPDRIISNIADENNKGTVITE